MYFNYPDSFADAIKDAGFDLVTTANNHVLDMGIDGARRTIEILKEKQIAYSGSYISKEDKEKNTIKIVYVKGIKLAILSYTYGANYFNENDFIDGNVSHVSSIIVSDKSNNYEKVRESIKKDFEIAKSSNPDLIVVLPHWGDQFINDPDAFQKLWRKNFVEFGADIILGDHTHNVQPVFISNENNKDVFTLYCPGNYACLYRRNNCDCSALVEVYIDKTSKKVIGGSIIPMWTTSQYIGNYRAIPIYDIITNSKLGKTLTTYDIERVQEVQKHITKVMLGSEIDLNMAQRRYYFDKYGFMRDKVSPILLTDAIKEKNIYKLLTNSKRICFIGDSITEGTKNGGIPWYEPLEPIISGEIINISRGSLTTKLLLNNYLKTISYTNADLFIIAIGTNDVRYRNNDCALTPEEYVKNLQILRNEIIKNNANAKFVFIAPWISTDGDCVSALSYKDKITINNQYTEALRI